MRLQGNERVLQGPIRGSQTDVKGGEASRFSFALGLLNILQSGTQCLIALQKIKEENERLLQEYGFCVMDNHKERIGNFRIEPPGLFRGRGDHPKMGMLKRRLRPEDIIINCSKCVISLSLLSHVLLVAILLDDRNKQAARWRNW